MTSREFRAAISRGASRDDLRTAALDTGIVPLRDHALNLVVDGLVPVTEMRELLTIEKLAPETPRSLGAPRTE